MAFFINRLEITTEERRLNRTKGGRPGQGIARFLVILIMKRGLQKHQASSNLNIDRLPPDAASRVTYARRTQNVVPEYAGEAGFVVVAGLSGLLIGLAVGELFPIIAEGLYLKAQLYNVSIRAGIPLFFTGVAGFGTTIWRMVSYDRKRQAHETEFEFSDPEAEGQVMIRIMEYHSEKHATTTAPITQDILQKLAVLFWDRGERILAQRALERVQIASRNNSAARTDLIEKLATLGNWLDEEKEGLTDNAGLRLWWLLDETGRTRHKRAYLQLGAQVGEDVSVIESEGLALRNEEG